MGQFQVLEELHARAPFAGGGKAIPGIGHGMGCCSASRTQEYDYEFRLWPREHTWERPVYEIFATYPRVVMTMSEADFQGFRDSLERSGFTLREASRVPHHDPETVVP